MVASIGYHSIPPLSAVVEVVLCLCPRARALFWNEHQEAHANWAVTLGLAKQLCLFCACAKVMLRINCLPWWLQETQSRRKITCKEGKGTCWFLECKKTQTKKHFKSGI